MANLSELTFMLWNATSLNNKEHELTYFINNNSINVVLVTETWLNPRTKINFVNYEIIRSDSSRRNNSGGVAIIINKQLKFHILPQVTIDGCDVLLIKIQSNIGLIVGVIYAPPKAKFSCNILNNIVTNNSPIIIGGDFNAKHKSWNNFNNNSRGLQLYNYINDNDISVIHSNTYTYRVPRSNPSNLDIFLTKDVPYNNICYSMDELTSNHLPVMLKFDRVNVTRTECTYNTTDWSAFYSRTDKWRIDCRQQNKQAIDLSIKTLQKFILNAYKQSSTYHRPKKRELLGKDEQAEIEKLIKLRNYYRRRFQRYGNNRYKILRNVLNKHIKATLIDF